MKEKKLNAYFCAFVLFAIAGSIMVFISGIDSVFDNPVGLFAVSILLGTIIAAILVCGYAFLNWIAPEKTKKIVSKFLCCDDTADEPMK